jgi:hypothetical protein
MKTSFISVLLILFGTNIYSQYFPVDTMKLNHAYNEMVNDPHNFAKEKTFLDAFPSTFSEYLMVYQYHPDPNYDLSMYFKCSDHVLKGLASLSLIPDTIFCEKLIKLSLNGRWNADAPNYLKMVLHQVMEKKTESLFHSLSEMEVGQQFSFWYFYFSSLYAKEVDTAHFLQIKMKMSNKYPIEVKEMEEGYNSGMGKAFLFEDFPSR